MDNTAQVVRNSGTSKTQLALAVFFLVIGVVALAKAAFYHGDAFMWVIGAFLIVSGIARLRGKST